MMEIVIFSSGRADRALTHHKLPPGIEVALCVPHGQEAEYKRTQVVTVIATPEGCTGIAKRRQWWLEHTQADKLLMLDDDLRFDTRRTDDTGKFLVATHDEVTALFHDIERQLDKYLHLTVTPREGGNRTGENGRYFEVGRATRVHGLRPKLIRGIGCRYDALPLMEDMDMTLQLLRKGHPNLIINYMVQGQGQSNAPGGCSLYRTPELQAQAARGLAERHRPHVALVERETKTAWGGGKRVDVLVQWQAAYQEGLLRAQGIEQKELL
jgi:TET-associated glycosyltransferase-like protein